ncbi:MAG TPA: DUF1501 domain-containing protein [Gemmatales bacterium]|nr:DUF1501 domain-containing protein [Gemmatales bacterium]
MARIRTLTGSISITRRSLLQYGTGVFLAWAGSSAWAARPDNRRCIFINLVGGPSHLDTWDPKPQAPSEYRGPFKAIATKVDGVQISELFPKMASRLDQMTLVRSVYHDAAPIHETGMQFLQQGSLCKFSSQNGLLLPGPIENTGVQLSHGQDGLVSPHHVNYQQTTLERASLREEYGLHTFGQSCLQARQAIEAGERFVVVKMFQNVYDCLSWDCHADGYSLNTKLSDYREKLAPMFDATFTTLLRDISQRGLLETTLVVAAGEFGRSPKINLRGGRDHWTGVWTVILAGAGFSNGKVIGSSDRLGMEPNSQPVHASAIANTVKSFLGVPYSVVHENGQPLQHTPATS